MEVAELTKIIDRNKKKKWLQLAIKRIVDIIGASVLLVILSPLFLIIVIGIKLDSEGEVIFKQTRVGLEGEEFTIYKFRTMVKDADKLFKKHEEIEDIENMVVQDKDDPRITRFGQFLRKTSLDEILQLINVIIGDMSLIGPRPEIPDIVNLFSDYGKLRHKMRPGVSGLAQVNGRSGLEIGKKLEYDIEYVTKFSLWLDFVILIKTMGVVFKGEGAY